jgi:hypothetical protein
MKTVLEKHNDPLSMVTTNGLISFLSFSHCSTISDHFGTESAGSDFENSKKFQTCSVCPGTAFLILQRLAPGQGWNYQWWLYHMAACAPI